MIAHNFTVDVEEYFHVSALEPYVPRARWDAMETRVVSSVMRLLELLDAHAARATFFVLGIVAERHGGLMRDITAAHHEIASHGWGHRKVTDLTPEEFRQSVRRSKVLLEDLTGTPVHGYRAPSFSIVAGHEWALDVLIEEGYLYDSSLFPVTRPGYGYRKGIQDAHWLERPAGRLAEIPPTTLRKFGVNLPAAGGAYFRLFPYALVRAGLASAERRGVAGTFYIHPWEIDPGQPRVATSAFTRLRHYGGLHRAIPRLKRLLSEFHFTAIAEKLSLSGASSLGLSRANRWPAASQARNGPRWAAKGAILATRHLVAGPDALHDTERD